jgi:ParB-like chromosome segregation protein Spo0J
MPEEMQRALSEGKIAEGHTRPLLMLTSRPEEMQTLFKEILLKRLTVRDTENIARRIAFDRVRKKEYLYAPEILEMERALSERLGTRVAIESREKGGKLSIDFFSEDDLRALFAVLQRNVGAQEGQLSPELPPAHEHAHEQAESLDDRTSEQKQRDENTFDPNSFSI